MKHPAGLFTDRLHDLRHRVAGHSREDPAEEVEIIPPLGVGHHAALAGDKFEGVFVVERQPGGEDLPVPLEQLRIVHGDMLMPAGTSGPVGSQRPRTWFTVVTRRRSQGRKPGKRTPRPGRRSRA